MARTVVRRPVRYSSSSSSDSEDMGPVVRKNRSPRNKKRSHSSSSSSDSSQPRGTLSRRKKREDGRGSPKERKRKSQLARNLPRRSNGTFAPISGFVSPPNRSSKSQQQESDSEESSVDTILRRYNFVQTPPNRSSKSHQQESDPGESFLNTTGPKLTLGRYIKDFVQTPKYQKRFQKSIEKSVVKIITETMIFSKYECCGLRPGTWRKILLLLQDFINTPERQKILKKQLMKTLDEMGEKIFEEEEDSSDDEKEEEKDGNKNRSLTPRGFSRM